MLRAAFGEARMETLDVYADLAASAGLVVDHREDLTEATLPTFDRWRSNAEEHREAVVAALGEQGTADFVGAADILEALWREKTMGYGLISAVRPE